MWFGQACFEVIDASEGSAEPLCAKIASSVQKHRATGSRIRDNQGYALFWYLDQVIAYVGVRMDSKDSSDRRARSGSSEFSSSPMLQSSTQSALKRVLEPWHALALSFVASTRLLKFQELLGRFLSRMMAADDDFANSVLVQHFHEHSYTAAHAQQEGGASSLLQLSPSVASGYDVEPADPLSPCFIEILRNYVMLQPQRLVTLLVKYISNVKVSVQHAALLLVHQLLTTSHDRVVAKLAINIGSSLNLFHALSEVLRRVAVASALPCTPLDCSNAMLACWCLAVLIPYSPRVLTATIRDVLTVVTALIAAYGVRSVKARSRSEDASDVFTAPSLPQLCPAKCGPHANPVAVTDALQFLMVCLFALYPVAVMEHVRGVLARLAAASEEATAVRSIVVESLSRLQMHSGLFADAASEVDPVRPRSLLLLDSSDF